MSSPEPTTPTATPSAIAEQVDGLYRQVDQALAAGGPSAVDEETIQRLVTLGVKLYAARRAEGDEFSPFVGESVNATEVSVIAMAMLKAVNLDVFELSLWRHWGRA